MRKIVVLLLELSGAFRLLLFEAVVVDCAGFDFDFGIDDDGDDVGAALVETLVPLAALETGGEEKAEYGLEFASGGEFLD